MSLTTDTVDVTGVRALRRLADFFELTKPRIVSYGAGDGLRRDFTSDPRKFLTICVCCKCYSEQRWQRAGPWHSISFSSADTDAMMERTRHRPLPDGRVQPREALWFGTAITIAGLVYLALVVNIRARGSPPRSP